MTNIIDLMPYIENKKAMDSFKRAEKENLEKMAHDINLFNIPQDFLREILRDNNKQLKMEEE